MNSITTSSIIQSLINQGREDAALGLCQGFKLENPDTVCEITDLLGKRGDFPRMLLFAKRSADVLPNHPDVISRYIAALIAAEEPGAAAEAASDFIKRTGNHGLWPMLAESLTQSGQIDKAGDVLRNYMPANPLNASAWIITARLLSISEEPDLSGILAGLDYEISTLQTEFSHDAAMLQFARGLMLEKMDDFRSSEKAFGFGNEILDSLEMSDPDELNNRTSQITKSMNTNWVFSKTISQKPGPVPIFLIGTRLSGIDKVRRILTSDSLVLDAGEPRMLERDLFIRFGPRHHENYVRGMLNLNQDDIEVLRDRYLDTLFPAVRKSEWFVDATPSNLEHAGLLSAMFPEARFIFCDRGFDREVVETFRTPLDVRSHPYSANFGKIKASVRAGKKLVNHWRMVLENPMTDVNTDDVNPDSLQELIGGWSPGEPSFPPVPTWPEASGSAFKAYDTGARWT